MRRVANGKGREGLWMGQVVDGTGCGWEGLLMGQVVDGKGCGWDGKS